MQRCCICRGEFADVIFNAKVGLVCRPCDETFRQIAEAERVFASFRPRSDFDDLTPERQPLPEYETPTTSPSFTVEALTWVNANGVRYFIVDTLRPDLVRDELRRQRMWPETHPEISMFRITKL